MNAFSIEKLLIKPFSLILVMTTMQIILVSQQKEVVIISQTFQAKMAILKDLSY